MRSGDDNDFDDDHAAGRRVLAVLHDDDEHEHKHDDCVPEDVRVALVDAGWRVVLLVESVPGFVPVRIASVRRH